MKFSKVWRCGVLALFLWGAVVLSPCYGDDFSIWREKWFKIYLTGSGYYTGPSGAMLSDWQGGFEYLKVEDFVETDTEKFFVIDWFTNDGGYLGNYKFNILGENTLDFLLWSHVSVSIEYFGSYFWGITARIQGKMKGPDLAGGTFKIIGGHSWGAIIQEGYIEYSAATLRAQGWLISESKLPFEPPSE